MASLGLERVQRLRDHLRPPLVVDPHERPDDGALRVDQERAPVRRAVPLVEDTVSLGRLAMRPEVRREGVLRAELALPRLSCGGRVAGDEDDLRPGVAERVEVLLEVPRLVLADRCEGEGMEDEEDVRAAEKVGEPDALPCGKGTTQDPGNILLLDSNGDAAVNVSDALYVLGFLFLGEAPPALGTGCVPMVGCPSTCDD